jgi:hypothetical protein
MCAMPHAIGQDFSDRSNCHYYFAVCESCFLIATILESREDCSFAYCPRCLEKENLSLIPLSPDEVNEMSH